MFGRINIKKELFRDRTGISTPEEKLMDEVSELLKTSGERDSAILKRLRKGKAKDAVIEPLGVSGADRDLVFSIDKIREVCLGYRLRFLDSKYFVGEYPYEAIMKIREFEKRNKITVKQFKVMAPTKMFRLIDPDKDPVLFANLGNGNYYFVQQWGNDMPWYRKFMAWPVRNLQHLLITILSIAFLLAVFMPIPDSIRTNMMLSESGKPVLIPLYLFRSMLFFLSAAGLSAFVVMRGLRMNKNLSEEEWDNKYLY